MNNVMNTAMNFGSTVMYTVMNTVMNTVIDVVMNTVMNTAIHTVMNTSTPTSTVIYFNHTKNQLHQVHNDRGSIVVLTRNYTGTVNLLCYFLITAIFVISNKI